MSETKTDAQLLEEVRAFIKDKFNPKHNGQGYWETGNFDDTFEMGEKSGYANALEDLGSMLGVELPNKIELNFD